MKTQLTAKYLETKMGKFLAVCTRKNLVLLEFEGRKKIEQQINSLEKTYETSIEFGENHLFDLLQNELDLYFEGQLQNFSTPLAFKGTEFQEKVWKALRAIPYGKTLSYEALAIKVGNPKAFRAAALANSLNKLAILVPCHRVIN